MSQSRQLAAIMFTDIVGYTALPENYGKESKKIGEHQIALAGCRLVQILGF